jgi:RNA polymerase sigma factor for flagellar operon FliA
VIDASQEGDLCRIARRSPKRRSRKEGRPRLSSEDDLILAYLPLVKSVVERMRLNLPAHLDADDLHSVGLAGLTQALSNFTPDKAASFASYATVRIRGAILDELRRQDWMSRGNRQQAKQVGEAIDGLEQRLGRPATPAEIAAELSISSEELAALLERTKPVLLLELDAEDCVDDHPGSLHDVIADHRQEDARDFLQRKERVELLVQRMQFLSDIQKKVLALYYFEELRLAEIAMVFGVTESRICQIHTQALRLLRKQMTSALSA